MITDGIECAEVSYVDVMADGLPVNQERKESETIVVQRPSSKFGSLEETASYIQEIRSGQTSVAENQQGRSSVSLGKIAPNQRPSMVAENLIQDSALKSETQPEQRKSVVGVGANRSRIQSQNRIEGSPCPSAERNAELTGRTPTPNTPSRMQTGDGPDNCSMIDDGKGSAVSLGMNKTPQPTTPNTIKIQPTRAYVSSPNISAGNMPRGRSASRTPCTGDGPLNIEIPSDRKQSAQSIDCTQSSAVETNTSRTASPGICLCEGDSRVSIRPLPKERGSSVSVCPQYLPQTYQRRPDSPVSLGDRNDVRTPIPIIREIKPSNMTMNQDSEYTVNIMTSDLISASPASIGSRNPSRTPSLTRRSVTPECIETKEKTDAPLPPISENKPSVSQMPFEQIGDGPKQSSTDHCRVQPIKANVLRTTVRSLN